VVRLLRGEAAGVSLGADPADRLMVNVASVPAVPADFSGSGQAHRPLLPSGRRGGAVVLRGRESPPHGKGFSERAARLEGGRSPVNTSASPPSLKQAQQRVLHFQRKLHDWASDDAGRGFRDLWNVVCDPGWWRGRG
jgi:hypothetical protein